MSYTFKNIIETTKKVMLGFTGKVIKNYTDEQLIEQYKIMRAKEHPDRNLLNLLCKEMMKRNLM